MSGIFLLRRGKLLAVRSRRLADIPRGADTADVSVALQMILMLERVELAKG
jgi:hypothetical protein